VGIALLEREGCEIILEKENISVSSDVNEPAFARQLASRIQKKQEKPS
jgi:hypothetical protein